MRYILVAYFFSLVSCAAMAMSTNKDNLLKLEPGMDSTQVLWIMGKPNFNEMYQTSDGATIRVLFYYTNRKWHDGDMS